ncbi:Hypothetical protein FKW44_024944 [Caligus rogercresseyi]|uniref:Uncharacterized protein n=1 Tax=Caligus rogercresseyi TaxID=217165 RepID=A0A7T8JTD2_CALRO|nr:Hypothetical protein FKW44_024944 [Caligus rogercresseyi]
MDFQEHAIFFQWFPEQDNAPNSSLGPILVISLNGPAGRRFKISLKKERPFIPTAM